VVSFLKNPPLDSFKTQVSTDKFWTVAKQVMLVLKFSTVKLFLTLSTFGSEQSQYPKVSIFDMVLMKSLDLDSFKNQVPTVDKFSTVLDSQEIIDSCKTHVSTVKKFSPVSKP
jgi:hypothetical protein